MRDQNYYQKLNQIRSRYDFLNQISRQNSNQRSSHKQAKPSKNREMAGNLNFESKQTIQRNPLCDSKPSNERVKEVQIRRQQLNLKLNRKNDSQNIQNDFKKQQTSQQQYFATKQHQNIIPTQQSHRMNNNRVQKLSLQNLQLNPSVSTYEPKNPKSNAHSNEGQYNIQKLNASINSIDSLQKRIQSMLKKR